MASNKIKVDAGLLNAATNEVMQHRPRTYSIDGRRPDRKSTVLLPYGNVTGDGLVISPEDVPDEYELKGEESGLLVIFNHENFLDHDRRLGTVKDQEDLIDTFSRLRYEIRRDLVFNDLNKADIEDQLTKIAKMDHSKRNSLVVVFLTHGDMGGKLYTSDDDFLTCEEVWNNFSPVKCPSLQGKPKIFLFQACKGRRTTSTMGVQEDSIRMDAAKKIYTLPVEADILVAFSTIEGNVAYRHTEFGSWFIQELCKNFTAYGRRDDLISIITRVSKCVAYHYQHENYKQMPCFISTLTRKFYLCKSKERGFLLDLIEQNKQLLNKIEKMEKDIEAMNVAKRERDIKERVAARSDQHVKRLSTHSKGSPEKPRWR
ncbi:Death related ICE-like caspase [Carabus blaptoides fortunei]